MTNVYDLVLPGLRLFNDNIHLGRENITLTFAKPLQSTETDDAGNAIIISEQIVLEGRATTGSLKERSNRDTVLGQDSHYGALKVNVTKVNGVPTTVIPDNIRPSDIAIAEYTDVGSGRTYTGEFYVKPKASYSIPSIYQKVGGILVGEFEVNGDGR